jgi:hypothetical protein
MHSIANTCTNVRIHATTKSPTRSQLHERKETTHVYPSPTITFQVSLDSLSHPLEELAMVRCQPKHLI